MIEVEVYTDGHGRCPFERWLDGLRDDRAVARILTRINRLQNGLEGDSKPVGDGVREMRISEGKGYRVYYAWKGNAAVILLCGGNKSTQRKDIEQAKRYWRQINGR